MSNRENEVNCPYCDVRIRTNRIQIHLLKCQKHHGNDKEYVTCTFNASHIVQKHELSRHLATCPNRAVVDRVVDYENDKMSNNNGGKKLLKGCTDVPPYNTYEIPCTEDWDDDTPPETPFGIFIPTHIHKQYNKTASLVGMVQHDSDIGNRQEDESKIQRNMDAVRKPDIRPKYRSRVFQYSVAAASTDRGNVFQGENRPNSQSLSSSLEPNTQSTETVSSRPSKTHKLMELLSLTTKSNDDEEDSQTLNDSVETIPDISTNRCLEEMQGVGRGFWKYNSPVYGRGHMVHHMTDHMTDDVQSASTTEATLTGVGRGAWIKNNPNPQKEVEMDGSKQDVGCRIQDKPTITIGNNQIQQAGVGRGAMLLKQLNLNSQNTEEKGTDQSSQGLQSCNTPQQKQSNKFPTCSVSGFGRDVQQDENEMIDLPAFLEKPILGIGRGARLLNGNQDPNFFPPSGIKSPNFTTDEAYFTDSSVSSNEYFETAKKLTEIN
ncbi:uncharacterized protein LOC126808617 [Patella vulgata]|uniref:uncharacterized protein LOC126808617 n=1 Tax=Patella vulgata TaxID=6465 RepID=UPI0024A7AC01|nr:uncharacterized protein LOC126808617 [Patella vulgata]XP_050389433.2 uncharacterized protein LOC126808617 [Patella vulgata]